MDTNDFLQIFRAQEAARQAETVGLMYAAMMGGLAGMAPLIYGATKKRLGLGFFGFLLCIGAGYLGSLFFAGPMAALFVFVIASQGGTPSLDTGRGTAQPSTTTGLYGADSTYVFRSSPAGEIPAHYYAVTGRNTVSFRGNGSLLKKEGNRYRLIGSLPRIESLQPEEKATYRIETENGTAYETDFQGDRYATAPLAQDTRPVGHSVPDDTASPVDRLSKLKSLKDSGDITPDEFERLKRHLLESTT